jgi:3-methyladenine DNA glycosylase Mpg
VLLAENGARYEQVPVNVLKSAPEHAARHPLGKVPVLDHDGFRIIETEAYRKARSACSPRDAKMIGCRARPGG